MLTIHKLHYILLLHLLYSRVIRLNFFFYSSLIIITESNYLIIFYKYIKTLKISD